MSIGSFNTNNETYRVSPVKTTAKVIEARLQALQYLIQKSYAWLDDGNTNEALESALNLSWCLTVEGCPFLELSKAWRYGKVGYTALSLAKSRYEWPNCKSDSYVRQRIQEMRENLRSLQAALHDLPEIKIANWAFFIS